MPTPLLLAAALIAQTATPAPQTAPQTAPPQGELAPPPEFITAAQGFGQCIGRSVSAAPASVTPEAAAKQAIAACATQRSAMDSRFAAWVASPSFPEAGRAMAREQYAASLSGIEAQIAGKVREARAKSPAPAAAPAPTATPTPR